MKADVLAIGSFPDATQAELANRFNLHWFAKMAQAREGLAPEVAARIRAIATEANHGADRALIARLPKLEVISVFGVGLDAVDLAAARERTLNVANTPGILADEVADLAIGLMLASARQIIDADRFVREHRWENIGQRVALLDIFCFHCGSQQEVDCAVNKDDELPQE